MKAIRFDTYGGPEVLHVVDVDTPHPGDNEIRIAVRAAGVNGVDWKIRQGFMKDFMPLDLPAGSGMDAAGVVTATGSNVTDVSIGDDVFGNGRETLAEEAILTSWVAKPAALTFDEAAGYALPVETAMRMIRLAKVHEGDTVLVSGAAGGVGSAVVQFAVELGATVIGTASSANFEYIKGLGATPLEYGPDLVERAAAIPDYGITVGLDVTGHDVLGELVELTGNPDRVVTIADFSMAYPGVHTSMAAEGYKGALAHAVDLVKQQRFRLPVARSFTLAQAGEAQAFNAEGHIAGRTIVTIP